MGGFCIVEIPFLQESFAEDQISEAVNYSGRGGVSVVRTIKSVANKHNVLQVSACNSTLYTTRCTAFPPRQDGGPS